MDKKFHHHPPEPYHVYKLFIACAIIGGEAQGGLETNDAAFFEEDDLPDLLIK
ncbi:hypothetical protein ACFOQM_10455 [Paenibacillus sp. GCM10012307]|uniref:ADP-ribose pyrophosphatase n=1 Tax=Paenibacillus roseus TaxID=2798579 RepID=A0A934ML24_9BACL|nr:hypothetical protein [Paenibacillus roseus]MBJ6361705.1 hypothetical protein [Paenibacillus roseus]